MKSWLRKKMWNFLQSGGPEVAVNTITLADNRLNSDGMNITVYGATGGHVVEFRRYDRIKDRSDNKMYVIPSGEEFSKEFSKIVSMEMMR